MNTKKEYGTIKNLVERLMERDERCRNSDKWLTYRVFEEIAKLHGEKIFIPFKLFRPSASMSNRRFSCLMRVWRTERIALLIPIPGPNARQSFSLTVLSMVLTAFADIRPALSSARGIVVKDGSIEATIGKILFGVATRTSPAPARNAARPASAAAPLIPKLPAMIQTLPKSPL